MHTGLIRVVNQSCNQSGAVRRQLPAGRIVDGQFVAVRAQGNDVQRQPGTLLVFFFYRLEKGGAVAANDLLRSVDDHLWRKHALQMESLVVVVLPLCISFRGKWIGPSLPIPIG